MAEDSENKDAPVVDSSQEQDKDSLSPSPFAISSAKHKLPSKLAKKTLIVALISAGVISSCVGAFMYFKQVQRNATTNGSNDKSQSQVPLEFSEEAFGKMGEAIDAETKEEGVRIIDDYISTGIGDPRDLAYMYSLKSSLLVQQGEFDSALEAILKAIDTNPDDPRYYAYAGEYYRYLGDDDSSKEYYKNALEAYDDGLPEKYNGPSRDYFVRYVDITEGDNS